MSLRRDHAIMRANLLAYLALQLVSCDSAELSRPADATAVDGPAAVDLSLADSGDGASPVDGAEDGAAPPADGQLGDGAPATDSALPPDSVPAVDAQPAPDSGPPDSAPGSGAYLILGQADLLARPTTGSAWTFLKSKADEAVAITLDASSKSSPWLPNYEVVAPKFLAAALVVASSWGGNKAPYRDAVRQALRHIVGSDQEPGSDGTSSSNALLATCRQLSAWVMAADLIGFDRTLSGSRAGWTGVSFESWLSAVRTTTIGSHGRWKTIVGTHENSASNWGAHCAASRIAASRYLGDSADLARAAQVVRGLLGDSVAYPAYPAGTKPAVGAGFQVTASFDSSWACNYTSAVGGWLPINPPDCGPGYDGAVVEDISRSAGAYPSWDSTGINYSYESLGALHLAAVLLQRAGYPAFGWSQDALRRGMQWLQRQGQLPSSSNSSTQRHISWITNHFYGTSLPTQPAAMGRALGFTDWLFP